MTDPGFAAAKINLTLHVTGRRADGYHLLDSLVAFAGVGDRVTAAPASMLQLQVTGPAAAGLDGDDNLVLRAARAFAAGQGAALTLDKHLPVASGIGGGSADAAATLRVLATLWRQPLPSAAQVLALGADVPVCLAGEVCRMRGIGEVLQPVPPLPPVWAVLANPSVAVATPAIFAALHRRDNPPMPDRIPGFADAKALADWLAGQRNDLQVPAVALAPGIAAVLAGLAALPGALLARMSGSGATCFALFADPQAAATAAQLMRNCQPAWWIAAGPLGSRAAVVPAA